MKIKIFTLIWFIFILTFYGTAWAEKFPDLGECTGSGVRLREEPDTDSEIIGKINKGTQFVLLDSKKINGDKWFLIDNPVDKGQAWIFGKYVKKYYTLKDSEHTPAHVTAMQIRLDYGITPEKAKVLHGKPLENLRDVYGNFIGLKYDNFSLYYDEENGYLNNVALGLENEEAQGNFGAIKIGDDKAKLFEIFGNDIRDEESFVGIDAPSGEVMYFNIDNNKVSSMQWLIEEH